MAEEGEVCEVNMRNYNLIMHIKFAFWYLFKIDRSGIKCLYCQNCGQSMFDTVEITEDTPTSYKAIYRCRNCGSLLHSTEEYEIHNNHKCE